MVHTNKQHKFKTSVNAQKVRVTSYKDVNFEGLRKSNCNLVLGFSSAGVIYDSMEGTGPVRDLDLRHCTQLTPILPQGYKDTRIFIAH